MSRSRLTPAEDLNLVPIMNLVTILIPFLLLAAQFVSIAVVDAALPAAVTDGPPPPPSDHLALNLMITAQGFVVDGGTPLRTADLGERGRFTLPCLAARCAQAEDWDLRGLGLVLGSIKDAFPDANELVIVPADGVPYEALVAAMDVARETPDRELFPVVSFAMASP